MNVLAFNIKTVPDIDAGQRIHSLQGLDDESTSKALYHLRKQQTGSDELALYLQRIASISIVYRGMDNDITVRSLGDEHTTEAELLTLFFTEIEKRSPTLVSWNGLSFDLPLIQYRLLKNKISASAEIFDAHQENYTDLQGLLSAGNSALKAPLNHIALMLGFPGNEVIDTEQIWEDFLKGKLKTAREHGEINAMNIYLIYLRVQLIQGGVTIEKLEQECELLKHMLNNQNNSKKAHFERFLAAWKA